MPHSVTECLMLACYVARACSWLSYNKQHKDFSFHGMWRQAIFLNYFWSKQIGDWYNNRFVTMENLKQVNNAWNVSISKCHFNCIQIHTSHLAGIGNFGIFKSRTKLINTIIRNVVISLNLKKISSQMKYPRNFCSNCSHVKLRVLDARSIPMGIIASYFTSWTKNLSYISRTRNPRHTLREY